VASCKEDQAERPLRQLKRQIAAGGSWASSGPTRCRPSPTGAATSLAAAIQRGEAVWGVAEGVTGS